MCWRARWSASSRASKPIGASRIEFSRKRPLDLVGAGLARMRDLTTRRFQRRIIKQATERLGRQLTEAETRFITDRGGFVALEMIYDTVRAASLSELEEYLNSEQPRP